MMQKEPKKEGTRAKAKTPTTRAAKRSNGAGAPGAGNAPTSAEIAKRAYEIWCGRGYPHGTDRENWLEAERQLLAERAPRA